MKSRKWLVLAAVSALVGAACVGTAAANSPSITRGDAEALFNAGTTGGEAINVHGGMTEGAPASPGRILPGPRFQGVHICAGDWHVMAIYLAITDVDDGPTNVGEARTYFSGVNVTYELDGAPLAIRTTPVKPALGDPTTLDPNATVAFSQHFGTILAPSALSVGAHTERVRIDDHGAVEDLGDVTFFVDAAGTGACL